MECCEDGAEGGEVVQSRDLSNHLVIRVAKALFQKTLGNVLFGISLMVGVALYVAIGSGVPSLRGYFEMTDLQFFNAWPLKLLMVLLVLNLSVVTWQRIPFTPPRYGVWCVHIGIITLIYGMAFYYRHKVEGTVMIPRGQTVSHFYDGEERALFFRVNGVATNAEAPVPSLPRFAAYGEEYGNGAKLQRRDLNDITPMVVKREDAGQRPHAVPLAQELGVEKELKVDITGYWPYANIVTDFEEGQQGGATGIKYSVSDPHSGKAFSQYLMGGSSDDTSAAGTALIGDVELRHVNAGSADELDVLKKAAARLHRIDVKVASANYADTMFVEIGKTYPLGSSGYSLTVESFNPAWPMFGTKEIVRALTLRVKAPGGKEFRRMVLGGKELQTDFIIGQGTGPMGKRQEKPLDNDLTLLYAFEDPFRLMPEQGTERHTVITGGGQAGMTDIAESFSGGGAVQGLPASGTIEVSLGGEDPAMNAPFLQAMGAAHGKGAGHKMAVQVEKRDHVRRLDHVEEVPPVKRKRDSATAGEFQVVRCRVRVGGDWLREVLVPYAQYAADTASGWDGEAVKLPGTELQLQMVLGNTRLALPAKLTLANFELVPYPGGGENRNSLMRDFKSTVRVEDPLSGDASTEVAHMNSPIYFAGGDWLFFQAAWDPEGQQWTILGVGNRPGVRVIITGCIMMVVGVLYAFYVKPIVVRRMKTNAIRRAGEKAMAKKQVRQLDEVGVG